MSVNLNIIAKADSERISSLPSFIREDYPKFVAFMSAYYKWMASYGADLGFEAMKGANDVDLVADVLLPKFKASYAANFPSESKVDFRHFSKFLKEFYQYKGTEEGYRLFYRAVFNDLVEIIQPRNSVLRTSSAVWKGSDIILLRKLNGEPFRAVGGAFRGETSGATLVVDSVVQNEELYSATIEGLEGTITNGETFSNEDSSISFTHVPQWKVERFSSSKGHSSGKILSVEGLEFHVDAIHQGKITEVTIEGGGAGYLVDDVIEGKGTNGGGGFATVVVQTDVAGSVEALKITRRGFGFADREVEFTGGSGSGLRLVPEFDVNHTRIKHLSILRNGEATGERKTVDVEGVTIELVAHPTHRRAGWVSEADMPSTGSAHIHDGDYYQSFSYELRSKADASSHQDDMTKLMHISGTKMFFGNIISKPVRP